jgi:integrase
VERVRGKEGYLFTTTGKTPVSGFSKAHSIIAAKMAKIASKEAGEPVEIAQFTWHDLRRTAATGMQRLGFPEGVIEAALNHISGTKAGIVGVYQRHDYADEKRTALEAWGRYVTGLVHGQPSNVVKLEARA